MCVLDTFKLVQNPYRPQISKFFKLKLPFKRQRNNQEIGKYTQLESAKGKISI